jgi:hypothetical protein
MSRQSCAVCAWRGNCNKRFSVSDGGARCPDYSHDISIKNIDDEVDKPAVTSSAIHDKCVSQVTKESKNT